MKFTEWLKWDYMNCKGAIYLLFKGRIPNWLFNIYYIIGGIVFLPFIPIAWLIVSRRVKRTKRILESFDRIEA